MISNKKSYAMKMLQLALALSLLHVNPDDYLQQRLRNWDSQLELRDGDGWELEMLRAVPMVEYPYANRKSMMPLIEDLILYDHQSESLANTQYNVTAYLLNVSNEGSNQTAAMQEMQAIPPPSVAATTTSGSAPGSATQSPSSSATGLENGRNTTTTVSSVILAPGSSNSTHLHNLPTPEMEMFLNSESMQDQRSIWEQNLADLSDFNDLPIMNSHYGNLPLKDGQQQDTSSGLFDLPHLDVFLPTFGSSANSVNTETEGAVALNGSFPNPDDEVAIKLEQLDDEDDKALLVGVMDTRAATCTTLSSDETEIANTCIKKEESDAEVNAVKQEKVEEEEVDLSPFISSVELTKEPKYDSKDIDEDDEQLVANEWAGIPFTIDNETGEYIRLPLDEILNDVIQFAELAGGETNEDDDTTGASTSKAAAAAANNKKQLKSDKEDNNNDSDSRNKSSGDLELKSEGGDDDLKDNDVEKKLSNLAKSEEEAKEDNNNNNADQEDANDDNDLPQSEIEVTSLPSPLFDLDDEAKEELADLSMMLHSSAPFAPHHHHHPHHPHHRGASAGGVQNYGGVNSAFHRQPSSGGFHHGHHQGRMPLSRGVSMEQRLQDIASLFNPMGVVGGVSEMSPYPHYPTHPYTYQSAPQHAQYPPPPPHPHHHHHAAAMLHPNASLGDLCSTQPHYGHNLGSAVSSSMHLTNSTHDSDVTGAVGGAYKMEHDMMYYSNASSDMNHTTDGFINSILNDEDLHLMDMNVNDSFCRMVDVNNSTSNNSSVLGLPTGPGHAVAGAITTATGGSTAGSTTAGLSMSAASNVAASAGAPGMTNELMNTTGAAAQAVGAGGADRLDASSDSAVSSMGSERVPSLSDGEWGEGSDSAQDYHQGKYGGPYDYSYNNSTTNNRLNDGSRQPPVAQKKHHMFGKRFLNEQPSAGNVGAASAANGATAGSNNVGTLVHGGPAHSIKYEYEAYPPVAGLHENMGGHGLDNGAMGGPALGKDHHAYGPGAYSLDFSLRTPRTPHELVQHNHTYTLPQGTGSLPRPQQRDKKISTSSSTKSAKSSHNSSSGSGGEEETYLTRDEKRARAMNIPIPVCDIINLPMDEFNERLSKYDLSENQLSLIRDIRRRGKNKVAAQNCRKRKLDQILSLEDEVKQVRRRKDELNAQRDRLFAERKRVSNKFSALHRHIFQYLRDPEGNPCSPSEYSLQQAADGSIYLLPRDAANKNDTTNPSVGGGGLLNGVAGSPLNAQNMPTASGHHHTQIAGHPHSASGAGGGHHLHQAPSQQQQTALHTAAAAGSLAHSHVQHHHQHHHQQQPQQHHHQQQQQQHHQTTHAAHGHHTTGGGSQHQQQPQKD
ncbi:NFE2 like bZIP transcription factor cap-n-collar isoform X2 [Musca autumnalis]|uniref:NFE2 like bZIP transcription factor cap-n-collar isoform X2 n=1 Tax=Musca autumnalis TaxID=221902 RepID=UPI003CEDA5F1